jgi:hypothetical protein
LAGRKCIIVGGFAFCGVSGILTAILYENNAPMCCIFSMAAFVGGW